MHARTTEDPFAIPIERLWHQPIPDMTGRRATTGYREIPIDTNHPQYDEPLVNLRDYGITCFSYYYGSEDATHPNNPPYNERLPYSTPDVWVRKDVAERLVKVDAYLKEHSRRLKVTDGYRDAELQEHLRTVWWPAHLKELHPDWSDKQIGAVLSSGFIAQARVDPLEPSPHLTGGAVDLTIEWLDGMSIDMGTPLETADTDLIYLDAFEPLVWKAAGRPGVNLEVAHNRRLLFWLMRFAGFWGHTNEWWHYMRGDQMWAQQEAYGKEPVSAFYSCAVPPDELVQSRA